MTRRTSRKAAVAAAVVTLSVAPAAGAEGFCGFGFDASPHAASWLVGDVGQRPASWRCRLGYIYKAQDGTTLFDKLDCRVRWPWGQTERYLCTNRQLANGNCAVYVDEWTTTRVGSRTSTMREPRRKLVGQSADAAFNLGR